MDDTRQGAPAFQPRFAVLTWIVMLLIVGGEAGAAYLGLSSGQLLNLLLLLATLEALLALLYFMHVRHERRALLWTIGFLVFALVMMNQIWFDALRLRALGR